jgi:hypothetical protein
MMIATLFLSLAAVTTAVRPEIVTPEPTTRAAQFLQTLQLAEETFASVQRELGLVGAAPFVGLGAEKPAVRPDAPGERKARVQKASVKTQR